MSYETGRKENVLECAASIGSKAVDHTAVDEQTIPRVKRDALRADLTAHRASLYHGQLKLFVPVPRDAAIPEFIELIVKEYEREFRRAAADRGLQGIVRYHIIELHCHPVLSMVW